MYGELTMPLKKERGNLPPTRYMEARLAVATSASLDMWTVACREQACMQFVSSSDNYTIMPTFLPTPRLVSRSGRILKRKVRAKAARISNGVWCQGSKGPFEYNGRLVNRDIPAPLATIAHNFTRC
ncbi:hypothetical protein V1478_008195 [Vespula squamosa]|uniref:Uncharacterized protein n=1 Tax=Vespula squamosa TaxID=30214 RepID=A0ABD2AY45_VESSQ